MSDEVGPPTSLFITAIPPPPISSGEVIETVTVEKSRLFDWGKWAAIFAVGFAVYLLLTRKARRG